ncbi:hypothetical protein, partial [Fibrobacter sp.]|uniref:hypothetical protein n=1 Tax=Fibrobacter sp. TaxID=35828 RepID=UPI00386B549C
NASFSFNEDGSKSFNLSVNASIPVLNTGLWFDAGIGFNVNTYTGASFSRSGGVCYGASKEAACAGVEVGQGFSWDRSGGFNGMTVYAEAYVTYAGVRTSVGGEAGFFGAEGRGLYAGIGGYGLHAQVAHLENGYDSKNVSWGVSGHLDLWSYDSQKGFDYFLKDFIDEIINGDEYESPKEDKNAIGKNLFGTIWCGAGPGGNGTVVTGGVDAVCRLHDFRYDAESKRTGKNIAGPKGALTNINQRIVAADVKLVANSFGNMLLAREPVAGFSVGVAFSLISAWKIPLMMFADLLPRFHFDDTYLRRSSWEKSLQQ